MIQKNFLLKNILSTLKYFFFVLKKVNLVTTLDNTMTWFGAKESIVRKGSPTIFSVITPPM
jgi:hypothetical protein